jgi:predicted DNA-binding transcriptional regulator YafY
MQFIERQGELRGIQFNFSIRTFKRDREDIASIYGFEIEYNPSIKAYKINQDIQSEAENRIIEAFDVIDAFNIKTNINNYVLFEERQQLGSENLFGILHAIKNNLNINFWYHRYQEANGSLKEVSPLALKEFKYRWYLLAKDFSSDEIKPFALDRLSNIFVTNVKFASQNRNLIKDLFNNCFGIFLPDKNQKVEHIILTFPKLKGKYIKSLKMHSSQNVIIDNEDEFRISLDIYITHDFIMELLSHGLELEVIEPKHLKETIIMHHAGALEKYNQQ